MKPTNRRSSLNLLLTTSTVMAAFSPFNSFAADFVWKGTTDSSWTTGTNWLGGTAPTYSATLTTDRLVIGNGSNPGVIYDPGSGVTTTFASGRGVIIGSTTQGAADLTVSSGTLKINGPGTAGNEPIMANGVSANVLINGGNLDFTDHGNAFRFFGSANTGLTSTLTISSGSFSSNGFNLLTTGTAGIGTINLDGGSLSVNAFTRSVTTATSILNLNGGTLRIRGASSANFLPALTGLQTVVKSGGAVIDSNNLNLTIAEALEHDSALGAGLDGGLTKSGAGILTLSGANTYNGATTINAGTVSAAKIDVSSGNSNLGDATSAVNLGSADAQGTLSYTGNTASYTRGFTIGGTGGGRLDVITAGQTLTVETAAITGSGLFTVGGNGRTLITSLISHTGGLTKGPFLANTTALTLSNGSNSYTGVTTVEHGAIVVTANGALGGTTSGTVVNSGATLAFSGSINHTAAESVTGSGAGSNSVSGIMADNQRGFIQSASGNNTFAGNVVIDAAGVSRIGTQNGASLTLTGTITQASGSIYFRPGNNAGDFVTLSNSGNSFGGNSAVFTGASSGNFAGVRIGVNNGLPANLTIIGDTATGAGTALDLNGFNQTLNGLAGGSTLNIINSNTSTASTLAIDTLAIDTLVDRTSAGTIIRGGGGLGTINVVKEGTLTQTLGATHDYTGTTEINEGTLIINGNISTSSLTTVASGATLAGFGTVGATTVDGGGFFAPGTSPGTLNTGSLTFANLSNLDYELNPTDLTVGSSINDLGNVSGNLTLDGVLNVTATSGDFLSVIPGTAWRLFNYTGSLTDNNLDFGTMPALGSGLSWAIDTSATGQINLTVTAIPEPAAALLSGLGFLALLRRRR
jgi:fibronectin-binding autotransporter adhesin